MKKSSKRFSRHGLTSAIEFSRSFSSEAETVAFAERLAPACTPTACITLSGDLGAGKSTFARAFIQALCGPVEVTSPTYTLMQEYEALTVHHGGNQTSIIHMDLYRIEHADMLEEIGFAEALSRGITLIEWPEAAEGLLPDSHLALHFTVVGECERHMVGKAGREWYACLKATGVI